MARIEIDPNYTSPTFARATAATDIFKKEDVQGVAAALSTHVHDGVHGLPLTGASIPNGTITSAMIADGTIATADLADGSVTSAKIADGTIATVDHADASVTNAKLASDTARLNLLTDGGFEVWQRGAGPFTGNGVYSADRWLSSLAGTDTLSVSRNAATVGPASNYSAACTFVLGTGAGVSCLLQAIKSAENAVLAGTTVTLSVLVRTSTANAVRVSIYDITTSTSVYSGFHTGGGSFERLSVSYTVPTTTGTVQAVIYFAASCTAYLDNAMLVVGSQAADYAPLHPADDLARCLRYYEAIGPGSTGGVSISGYGTAGLVTGTTYRTAYKSVLPTLTKVGTWNLTNCGQPSANSADRDSFFFQTTVTALGAFTTYNGTAGNWITVESNP